MGNGSPFQYSFAGKFVPADGGNGGKGGDVIIRASGPIKSLSNVQKIQMAPRGRAGGNQRRRGADGADLTLLVPCGTVVFRGPDTVLHLDGGYF